MCCYVVVIVPRLHGISWFDHRRPALRPIYGSLSSDICRLILFARHFWEADDGFISRRGLFCVEDTFQSRWVFVVMSQHPSWNVIGQRKRKQHAHRGRVQVEPNSLRMQDVTLRNRARKQILFAKYPHLWTEIPHPWRSEHHLVSIAEFVM